MDIALLAGLVILGGMILGWVFHDRSIRKMTPILHRLAAEKNGMVQSPRLFLMPTLRFSHSDMEVEVSSASTGIDGESTRYTYVVFSGMDFKGFEFRILPRSLQTIGDKWIGFSTPMSTGFDKLDERLVVCTNNNALMEPGFAPSRDACLVRQQLAMVASRDKKLQEETSHGWSFW